MMSSETQSDSLGGRRRLEYLPACPLSSVPLGRTRGYGRRFIYPRRVREERKKIPCSNARFPAALAWPRLGQPEPQREELEQA